MKKNVLFIHGAGEGAYEEDRLMVASLQDALGAAYEVHYPRIRQVSFCWRNAVLTTAWFIFATG